MEGRFFRFIAVERARKLPMTQRSPPARRILVDGRRQGLRIASCPPRWQPAPAKGEMTMMLENRAPRIFLGIFLAIFVAPAESFPSNICFFGFIASTSNHSQSPPRSRG